jgi:integrase
MAPKRRLLSIGAYPTISIKMAREARDDARRLLATGVDPSQAKKETKRAVEAATRHTFRAVADEYLAKLKREGRAEVTLGKLEWILGFAHQAIGSRPIREITAPEILELLLKLEDRGVHETANRLRSTIGAVFRFGVATARADNDPTYALKGALARPVVVSRAAITQKGAFGALLRAMDGFDGQETTCAALKLMALLYPRPGELRLARWQEFDLDAGVWIIPAARMKMRREHRVPLPHQAVEILRALHRSTGRGELVFPSVRSSQRPISENTLNAALRRMGYGKDEATAHGFRSTFSTIANEAGKWNSDAIERALAHIENNDVRRAYLRAEYWDERVAMAQWWADLLDKLRVSTPGGSLP